MSVERLERGLSDLGLDGQICVELLQSSFATLASNPERLKFAKDFLTESGIAVADVTKLLPAISRFVVDFGSGALGAPPVPAVSVPPSPPAAAAEAPTKKKKATVIRGKELAEFFSFKTPNYVQQYSDDEKNPKPKISTFRQPAQVLAPKPQISVVNKTPVVSAPWMAAAPPTPPLVPAPAPAVVAPPAAVPKSQQAGEYGGFW